jgi:Holliday junction resolvase RusA-like endonuclease
VWTGKYLITSKYTRSYENSTIYIYRAYKTKFKKMVGLRKYPLKVGFYFIRDSKARFDYTNIVQKVADMMVDAGWIDDDDMDHFNPVFLGYEVDKANAGVQISILTSDC